MTPTDHVRRIDLAEKKSREGLTPDELQEFVALQNAFFATQDDVRNLLAKELTAKLDAMERRLSQRDGTQHKDEDGPVQPF